MTADFSWERSAEAYLQLYRKALEKKRGNLSG
jgi:glycogen synthase